MVAASSTCASKGFEEPTFFLGPDGHLHFLGHDHGKCKGLADYAHRISPSGSIGGPWLAAPNFGAEGDAHPWREPVPVPRDGSGQFGDLPSTGVPERWIDFDPGDGGGLYMLSVEWIWSNTSLTSS